jgi:hypothetical protein
MNRIFTQQKRPLLGLFLIILVSSLGIFFFNIQSAKAYCSPLSLDFNPEGCVAEISLGIFNRVTQLFNNLIQIAVNMLTNLLNWSNFIKVDIVQIGWKITRDLANMFFVLILLVIAFATILRVETYGMKALLPKLIAAALLINFSLVIGGAIIDFFQVMTDFLISKAGGDTFSTNIMNATQAVKGLIRDPNKEVGGELKLMWNAAIGSFLNVIFLLIILFVMGAYALFLIVRIVALWFLLILAPIVWILWILPRTRNFWDQWWANFIKWCVFAPASAFFLYLAIVSYKALLTENIVSALKANDYSTLLPSFTRPDFLLQYLLVIGILFGGLIVAQKMGVYGGESAIKIAKGAGKGTAKWTGRKMQIWGQKPIGGRVGAVGDKLRRGLERFPLLRHVTRPLRTITEKERAAIAAEEKKYKDWTTDNLKSQYKTTDTRGKVAIAKILADRGDFNEGAEFGDKQMKQALKLAKRYNQEGSILKARPDLAPLVKKKGESDEKAIYNALGKLKEKDMEKLQVDAFKGEGEYQQMTREQFRKHLTDETGKLKSNHLSKLPGENPHVFVEVNQNIIQEHKGTFRKDIETYLDSVPGKAVYGKLGGKQKIKIVTPPGAGGRKISEEELAKAREALKR